MRDYYKKKDNCDINSACNKINKTITILLKIKNCCTCMRTNLFSFHTVSPFKNSVLRINFITISHFYQKLLIVYLTVKWCEGTVFIKFHLYQDSPSGFFSYHQNHMITVQVSDPILITATL